MMHRLLLAVLILPTMLHFRPLIGQDGAQVNFIREGGQIADLAWQEELRAGSAWQQFAGAHPGWAVEFNEASGKPHRAFGPPVPTVGASPEERALQFIETELAHFAIPVDELLHRVTLPTSKFNYVHFSQLHQGIPVIKGHLLVKMDHQGRVILFGADVHDDIALDVQPSFPQPAAANVAADGLSNVVGMEFNGLHILPMPNGRSTDHRLVHEVLVRTMHADLPGRYLCWVDAHSGVLLYRRNLVLSKCSHDMDAGDDADAGADAVVEGEVYINGPLQPTQVVGLPDLRLSINGNFLYTDMDGAVASGIPGPVNGDFQLRGLWSNVTTNNNTPSFTSTLEEGPNTVSFNTAANIRQRTAYFAVNAIHGHMKNTLPDFTGMDFALPTKVDLTTGDCNAFYDGSSINFYAEGNGCRSYATVPDVVFHEYGHGINDKFYQAFSSSFTNGAMNEGYADFWAFSLTLNPILAQGHQLSNPNSFIRRYDINPRVYPMDLVGQVHADGEIIAGAWWDTYTLLGDLELTMQLFAEAFPGLQATAFNGQEGQAYRDVLIDVLQADDDDMDITNGTPNGAAIVEGFAIHGITLLSNVELQHTAVESAPSDVGITLTANVTITFPFNTYLNGVRAFYRVNADPEWNSVLMVNSSGSLYSAELPDQPEGTVIAYYLAVEDIFGQTSSVKPIGSAQEEPNIPNFILVGYELRATEDSDLTHELGEWITGQPEDNATTGQWEQNVPMPSFSAGGIMVQPGFQHTPGGDFCWVTQNATSESAGLGEADVDGGSTTLISGNIDLTDYENPAFTYWRWYINNPPSGANPNADWWQVYISNNGGVSWIPVEDTRTSDRSWRRMAFRVQDYVELTNAIRIKFIASDSIRPGQNLDGGSLVEAAVDDIQLWDVGESTIGMAELPAASFVALYPDPASDMLNVVLNVNTVRGLTMDVVDITGRTVIQVPAMGGTYNERQQLDVRRLAEGQYVLRLLWEGGMAERRFTVLR